MIGDYWALVRPRITAMVLVTMAAAAFSSSSYQPGSGILLAHALVGTGLVIAGAVALNQSLELRGDSRMTRTAGRPLPSGRLTRQQATAFGLASTAAGLVYLYLQATLTLVLLAGASWALYVGTYTPMKSRSAWQTPVGALAGAMPVLLGAAAVDGLTSVAAWSLFAVLFFWQFPHAMAIAWLYRREFAAAEVRLATVVDPSGRAAAAIAVLGAAALLPASLTPAWYGTPGTAYVAAALALGAMYLAAALAFARSPGDAAARWLLRASLVYLPGILAAIVLLN